MARAQHRHPSARSIGQPIGRRARRRRRIHIATNAARFATPVAADRYCMNRALQLARRAAWLGEVPVGAVVVCDDRIIGSGFNQRESLEDPTAHAEIIALRRAAIARRCWRLDDCTLYVTLEPCPMCAGAIVNARLGRLVYGAADPKMGAVDTLYRLCTDDRLNHRLSITRDLLGDQSAALLRSFFRQRR
jgi:tRNA(adenine34) deaminase